MSPTKKAIIAAIPPRKTVSRIPLIRLCSVTYPLRAPMKARATAVEKEDNINRVNGEATRYRLCNTKRHILSKNSHLWENTENVKEEGNTNAGTILLAMGEVNHNLREIKRL